MSHFMVDVEADGPAAGPYSMVSIGVVRVDRDLTTTFFGRFRPISERWVPEALAVSGVTRAQHLAYPDPAVEMTRLAAWLQEHSQGRPIMLSDNPAFDWSWVNYYAVVFLGSNPFGHSARRIGDLYAGLTRDFFGASKWRKLRRTPHTHHPVDDAKGNAEALLAMLDEAGIRHPWLSNHG